MKWKHFWGIAIPFLGQFLAASAQGGNYSVLLEYNRTAKFPALREKAGLTVAVAPVEDERSDKEFIGRYSPRRNQPSYFKSEPVSIDKAIQECFRTALIRSGIETVPVLSWDGKPEFLKRMSADAILRVVIRRFWMEGTAGPLRTKLYASIHFVCSLGVKKLGRVFIQNILMEKNRTLGTLSPQGVVEWINRNSEDAVDSFLSSLY